MAGSSWATWGPALVVAALVFGAVLGGGYVRSRGDSDRSDEDLERRDAQPAPKPASPCALGEAAEPDTELDPDVVEVCRLIRMDHFDVADLLWEQERGRRGVSEERGELTLIVARTFIEQAEALEPHNQDGARAAASRGLGWAARAATDLQQPQHPEVQDLERRAGLLKQKLNADG